MNEVIEVNKEIRNKIIKEIEEKIYSIPENLFIKNKGYDNLYTCRINEIAINRKALILFSIETISLLKINETNIRYLGLNENVINTITTADLINLNQNILLYNAAVEYKKNICEKYKNIIPIGTLITEYSNFYIVDSLPEFNEYCEISVNTKQIFSDFQISLYVKNWSIDSLLSNTKKYKDKLYNNNYNSCGIIVDKDYVFNSIKDGYEKTIESRNNNIKELNKQIEKSKQDIIYYSEILDNLSNTFNTGYNDFLKNIKL